jgi:adenosylmethionine-8-amino-7-oxononanoate aminotransferase
MGWRRGCARFGQHSHDGGIRGRGLFWALELFEDRASKRPFDAQRGISTTLKLQALENGLVCYPIAVTFFREATRPDRMIVAPRLLTTVTAAQRRPRPLLRFEPQTGRLRTVDQPILEK